MGGHSSPCGRQPGGIKIRILGFDSAAKTVGVALSEEGRLLGQSVLARPRSASALLTGLSQTLLANLQLDLDDIDGLAVSQGPGSFTGLRITSSFMAGLARSRGIPVTGVVTNAALVAAVPAGEGGYLVGATDARSSAVYSAVYYRPREYDSHGPYWSSVQVISPRRRSIRQTVCMLKRHVPSDCRLVWVGDGINPSDFPTFCEFRKGRSGDTQFVRRPIDPAAVAYLGWQRLNRGCVSPLNRLHPRYYRKSSAERSTGEAT